MSVYSRAQPVRLLDEAAVPTTATKTFATKTFATKTDATKSVASQGRCNLRHRPPLTHTLSR